MRPPLALLLGDSASYGGALLRHYIYLPVYEVPMSMGREVGHIFKISSNRTCDTPL